MTELLSLSVALFAGLLLTRPLSRFHLPDVTAYLIAGVLIGPCCFETHRDVPDAIEAWLGKEAADYYRLSSNISHLSLEQKFLVDLRGANACRLRQLGLSPEHIDISDECTFCSHDKYWSHRYTKGMRGGQAACIVIPEGEEGV